MSKDYYQYFDDLISHINKTIPTIVKEYNLEVYHSGGGCFILQIDKEKIEIGITPIEKIIVNEIANLPNNINLFSLLYRFAINLSFLSSNTSILVIFLSIFFYYP